MDRSDWGRLVQRQAGAVSRAQLLARGYSRAEYRAHLAAGRWQQPIPGIYVMFTGPLPISTVYWVALLHAGAGAMLSHATAAVLWKLLPEQAAGPVHVTVSAHGLPLGLRQRAVGRTRRDVYYDEFATTVELDGRVTHQLSGAAWRDMVRDNSAAERGETTLRYGWHDVRYHPCAVAAQVAAVLRTNGWTGHPHPCRPGCPVR